MSGIRCPGIQVMRYDLNDLNNGLVESLIEKYRILSLYKQLSFSQVLKKICLFVVTWIDRVPKI